jgi:aflatoxin B1 aldehyde reductase
VYAGGTCEEMLGDVQWQERGIKMQTKLYPTAGKSMNAMSSESYIHSATDVRAGLLKSFEALKTDKIDVFYLHGPDRKTNFEITMREINKLHQEGRFERFGLSDFMSWEVSQICEISKKNGWIMPSVYQGIYNTLHRAVEPELFPCLRHYGISLYAFQPLAGGLLIGKFNLDTKEFEAGSRFDPKRWQGKLHHSRYWNEDYFKALSGIREAAEKHSLIVAECALRWMMHHSQLKGEHCDAVIIGASSAKQLEINLVDLEKGPLSEDVVKALDDGWQLVKGFQGKYWY